MFNWLYFLSKSITPNIREFELIGCPLVRDKSDRIDFSIFIKKNIISFEKTQSPKHQTIACDASSQSTIINVFAIFS